MKRFPSRQNKETATAGPLRTLHIYHKEEGLAVKQVGKQNSKANKTGVSMDEKKKEWVRTTQSFGGQHQREPADPSEFHSGQASTRWGKAIILRKSI